MNRIWKLFATVCILGLALPGKSYLAIAQMAPQIPGDKVSSLGVYRGYAPKLYSERLRQAIYVTARDGTKLAIDIYRPARSGVAVSTPYPVLWVFTPYRRGFMGKDGTVQLSGGMRGDDIRALTDYGYVVAIADVRGKGASFGTRRGMNDRTEAQDGYDLTEWLAKQPWSTGKIGMAGCSYVGGTQEAILSTAPPHLVAVFPGATSFSRYDFVSRGGMTAQYHTRPEQPEYDEGVGSLPVDADLDGALLAAARKEHAANTPMPEIWKAIPYRDDWSPLMKSRYWEEVSVSQRRVDIERTGIAIYKWGSWQDEFSADQFLALANLHNPIKLTMLAGEHCNLDGFDLVAEQHRFFDYWLKGIQNGVMEGDPITYYTFNAPIGKAWRTAKTWPLPQTIKRRFFLTAGVAQGKAESGITLMDRAPALGVDHFKVDYSVLVNDGSTPSWIPSQDGHGLSFETAAFRQDVEVTGHPVLHLWLSSTATDGDIFAYLEEVGPDGIAVVRSHGRLRASHRSLGTAPFDTLGLPWHRSFRMDVEPLVPGKAVALDFDMLPTSTIVKAGSRLRLVVAGADSRQRMGPPTALPPTVTVYVGGNKASYVDIPVIPAGH